MFQCCCPDLCRELAVGCVVYTLAGRCVGARNRRRGRHALRLRHRRRRHAGANHTGCHGKCHIYPITEVQQALA